MNGFGIGSLSCYDSLDQVGEGTYGYVYKGKDIRNNETVALKRYLSHLALLFLSKKFFKD
jgi:serine/threonine protein kinase